MQTKARKTLKTAIFISIILSAFFSFNLAASNKYKRDKEKTQASPELVQSAAGPKEPLPSVYIEVNIPATEFMLYENGKPLYVKPVAIGQGVYPTPEQESTIKKIEWNPWWYPPDAEWAKNDKPTPPGPGNPLGLVKMPLSGEILFHGTNKERSIGRPASHGCMRMFNADAVEVAWYLQRHFSEKKDSSLREIYKKNSKTTYVVELASPVPVRLVYRPLILRNNMLIFYPDYYNRLKGKKMKINAILAAINESKKAPSELDEKKIHELAAHWPPRGTEIPIESFAKSAKQELPKKPKNIKHERRSQYR